MSRTQKTKLPYWRSKTCKAGEPWAQIGATLLQSEQFKSLSGQAKITYIAMIAEAKESPTFEFPKSTAQKYGIKERTLRDSVNVLLQKGFIERTSGKNTREPNTYKFSRKWKDP